MPPKDYYERKSLQHNLEIDFKNKMKIEQAIYKQSVMAMFTTKIDHLLVTNYLN
jgi:hypothetical protein